MTIGSIDVLVIKRRVVNTSVIVTMGVDNISIVTDESRGDVILVVVTMDVSGSGVVNAKVDNTGLVGIDVTAVVGTVSVSTSVSIG